MTAKQTPEYVTMSGHTAVKVPDDVAEMLRTVDELETRSEELHKKAKVLRRQAVATLKARKWKNAEIGAVLGVVSQRVWQILNNTY